jgi:hypothetical protein
MSLDLNELRAEQRRVETQGQSSFLDNFVKMPEGEGSVTVRLLPSRKGGKLYCVTRTHKLGNKNFHCLQTLIGTRWEGHCPVCNYYRGLWKESDKSGRERAEQLQAEARTIKPIERIYYNCIVREVISLNGDKSMNVGPKILSVGKTLHARVIRAILGDPAVDEPELGDISDPETGRDFKIIKKLVKGGGSTAFPNYDQSKFLGVSPLGTEKQVAAWMETLHDLQALRQLKPYEELQKELDVFRGVVADPDLEPYRPAETMERRNAVPVMATPKVVASVVDDDESLADDEFIRELRREI